MTINTMNAVVVRTERGLTVRGTRLTLYLLMDCIHAGWSAAEIKECYSLTDDEYAEILAYIDNHQPEFELEYQEVVKRAVELQAYWEVRNLEQRKQRKKAPPAGDTQLLYARLREQQAEYSAERPQF